MYGPFSGNKQFYQVQTLNTYVQSYTLLDKAIDFLQESHLLTKLKEKSLKYLQFLHRFEMVDYGRIVIADDSF